MVHTSRMFEHIRRFVKLEAASGLMLMAATVFALIAANSPWQNFYESALSIKLTVAIEDFAISKPIFLWINDGLMAIFFLLVGLELKREAIVGELNTPKKVMLPAIGALGGMVFPALIYAGININDPIAIQGWAIPTATDIAFALGILSLLGNRVPASLKIFLMALAIIDDLGAIVIIALFYTTELSTLSIGVAAGALVVLIALNKFGVTKKAAYFIVGTVLWVSVLKSGVHATLAGVALAFTIPITGKDENGQTCSPLKEIEHGLHFWVAFFILPLFAFVNAGVDITQISLNQMSGAVPLGIMLGLFVGKQVGVFGFSFVAIKLGIAKLPEGSGWAQLYGVSLLTGIGFTMSLFITSLAFVDDSVFQFTDKLAILIASVVAGVLGYLILRFAKQPA